MTSNVLSAARVLDLLELVAAAADGVSLREAAGDLQAPKSSTLMLLRTLVNRGYVYRDPLSDRYVLSDHHRTGAFGWTADPHARLASTAQPILQSLSRELGETTTIGIWAHPGHAKLLTKVVADLDVRYDTDVARPIPLYCTAIGRVLLSSRTAEDREALIGQGPFETLTRHTITDRQRLLAIVSQARDDGFAIVMEEFALGGTGVAAPVLDADGRAVAALNVGCVTNRFEEKRDKVITAVMRDAQILAALLQVTAPPPRVASHGA